MHFSLNIIRAPEWKDVEMGRRNAEHTGLGKCWKM